jgi:hypothetical protein
MVRRRLEQRRLPAAASAVIAAGRLPDPEGGSEPDHRRDGGKR